VRIDATVALVVAATAVVVGAVAVAVEMTGGPAEDPASPPAAIAPPTPRPTGTTTPAAIPDPTPEPEPDPDAVAREVARAVYDGLSDEQRLGQLLMVSVYGSTIDEAHDGNQALHGVATIGEVIDRWQPGGFIYFVTQSGPTGNLEDPAQIRALSDAIHARSGGAGVPAVIGIDQEHGRVDRLGPPATQFPGAMALGATGDPSLVREVAAAIGTELRALGIDLDFAPVADLQSNPANPVIGTRSFGADPARVAPLLDAAITGFADAGVAATAKHFPGHGDTDVDSHAALPTIERAEAQLRSEDLVAFAAAVAAHVPAVMTGHLRVPALDPSGAPATTSGPVLTGILRGELGYDGVVVTDALDMAGARQTAPDDALAVGALAAGADLLLMPPSTEVAVRAIADAVGDGRLDLQRVEEAVLRILTLKARLGLLGGAAADGEDVALEAVGAPPHAALAVGARVRLTSGADAVQHDAGQLRPVALGLDLQQAADHRRERSSSRRPSAASCPCGTGRG
jgi:beta-N-acetylhexosaminidase